MTTPTLATSRTWRTNLNKWIQRNTTVAAGDTIDASNDKKSVLLHIKDQFKALGANPWVVTKSYGFASGLNLSGDNWATIADIRFQTSATNRPWIVMYCAAMNLEFLFNCVGVSGQRGCRANIYVSRSASGTSFTGGSSSARPTSATEILALDSSDGTGFGNWGVGGTSTAVRDFAVHVWHDDAGKGSRAVIQFNDKVRGIWILDALTDNQVGLVNPWVASFRQEDAGDTPDTGLRPHYFDTARLVVADDSDVRTFAFAGTLGRGSGGTITPANSMRHPRSTKDNSIIAQPIGIVSITDSIGYRGRLEDTWLGPGVEATTGVTKTSFHMNLYRNKTLVSAGDLVLPWDGTSAVTVSPT